MTDHAISAVLFDMGGTIEDVYFDDAMRRDASRGMQELMTARGLETGLSLLDLNAAIMAGLQRYRIYREQSEIELPPERIWAEYIFPHSRLPADRLAAAAEDLAFYYETHYHQRRMRPEAPATLAALRQRGFRLAVISNIMSRRLAPHCLEKYGLTGYFEQVLTSVGSGWRKPNPLIFLDAAQRLGLPPSACAYVGDTVSRDVSGARRAGYGLAIQIKSFLTTVSDGPADVEQPDAVVSSLMDVVALVTRAWRRLDQWVLLPAPHRLLHRQLAAISQGRRIAIPRYDFVFAASSHDLHGNLKPGCTPIEIEPADIVFIEGNFPFLLGEVVHMIGIKVVYLTGDAS